MAGEINDTETVGSRLPAEVAWAGAPSGLGLKPDLEMIAGTSEGTVPPRPAFAAANDAAFDHGVIAEGKMNGETNNEGRIPWL